VVNEKELLEFIKALRKKSDGELLEFVLQVKKDKNQIIELKKDIELTCNQFADMELQMEDSIDQVDEFWREEIRKIDPESKLLRQNTNFCPTCNRLIFHNKLGILYCGNSGNGECRVRGN